MGKESRHTSNNQRREHMTPRMSSSDFNKGKQIVAVEGVFIRETKLAKLVVFNSKQCWLPVPQFGKEMEILDVSTGDCVVYIPRWLADKNELGYDELEEDELKLGEKDEADQDSYGRMMDGEESP